MLRAALFLSVCTLYLTGSYSQPVECNNEDHCSVGYYCDTDVHSCRECLKCNELNREPPKTPNDCIKSVSECGDCLKGLVVDRLGDVNAACVSSPDESAGIPHYVWWLGSIIFIFIALMIGIIVYICINPGIFENFKFGGNCPSGTVSTNIRTETLASAPEAPPPYSPTHYNGIPYSAVRTESPCPPQHEAGDTAARVFTEEEGPFIKRATPIQPTGVREKAGSQAARVFNPPIYEREEQHPSDEVPMVSELQDNLAIHNEETMESVWSPSGNNNGDINANISDVGTGNTETTGINLPMSLAAARDNSLFEHTPPKRLCVRQNSNYSNRDSSQSGDSTQGNFSGTHNGPPYNIITQITNVVQFNKTS